MLWTEGVAGRGSNEICSSIFSFLQIKDLSTVNRIKTFSDGCIGQNKNKTIIAFFMYILNLYDIEYWEHTYMVSGHSYLPNDRDFGLIGKAGKRIPRIFTFEEWVEVVKTAKKKDPFVAIDMSGRFKLFDVLSKARRYNRKFSNTDECFSFPQLSKFTVTRGSDDVGYELFSGTKGVMKFPLINPSLPLILPNNDESVKISSEKFNDLMKLLHLIPPEHHDFYKNLPH